MIDNIDINNIKNAYSEIVNSSLENIDSIYKSKQAEFDLKYSYAENKNFKKNDDSIDTSVIKSDLLKLAISIKKNNAPNSIDEKLSLLESYLEDIDSNLLDSNFIDIFVDSIDDITESKNVLKNIKKDYNILIDSEKFKIIESLVNERVFDYKFQKENEFRKENGLAEKVMKNNASNDSSIDLFNEIKKLLIN
jgi:hypothetical protein